MISRQRPVEFRATNAVKCEIKCRTKSSPQNVQMSRLDSRADCKSAVRGGNGGGVKMHRAGGGRTETSSAGPDRGWFVTFVPG